MSTYATFTHAFQTNHSPLSCMSCQRCLLHQHIRSTSKQCRAGSNAHQVMVRLRFAIESHHSQPIMYLLQCSTVPATSQPTQQNTAWLDCNWEAPHQQHSIPETPSHHAARTSSSSLSCCSSTDECSGLATQYGRDVSGLPCCFGPGTGHPPG